MFPYMEIIRQGAEPLRIPGGPDLVDILRGRLYFVISDNAFALQNCGLNLRLIWATRDHMSFGHIIDEHPFQMSYVTDLKSPILTTTRYYPEYFIHPLDTL